MPDALLARTLPLERPHEEIAHPRPFLCELVVQPGHLSGVVEHVSNLEYPRWIDRAAELHSDSLGYTRARLLDDDVMWFVARHEIDYRAETWLDDRLTIVTWVRDVRRVKSWRETVILRPADDTVVCRCSTLWVLVRLSTRRPCRIPAAMVERLDPLLPPVVRHHPDGQRS